VGFVCLAVLQFELSFAIARQALEPWLPSLFALLTFQIGSHIFAQYNLRLNSIYTS
jgi:hypothetical protein